MSKLVLFECHADAYLFLSFTKIDLEDQQYFPAPMIKNLIGQSYYLISNSMEVNPRILTGVGENGSQISPGSNMILELSFIAHVWVEFCKHFSY